VTLALVAPQNQDIEGMVRHPLVQAVLRMWPDILLTTPRERLALRMIDPTPTEFEAMEEGSLPALGAFMDEKFGANATVYDLAKLSDDDIMCMIEVIVSGYVGKLHEKVAARNAMAAAARDPARIPG
jgi:hypothetical protein